ncbi:hypothetical protein HHL16_03550 [Pseudoflavitalea sp. G-6-1-2]|uniref:hypothetical protein n=1 Tax=Pseudoflavitalea sp. G-6-1-2 TaxID=2728841 RepID=UPI00146A370C|nr:hypothetical protein [Pseudoflavitalea sp. G-6-1-2]NML19931.1 hypothetical protein [Pseudoflavitalea sp. G-6-1-2]
MNRRNFLFRTGMIAPAVLMMPDMVVAEIQLDDADILLVQGMGTKTAGVTDSFLKSGGKVKEVKLGQLESVNWNGQRFTATTRGGAKVTAKKVAFNTAYMIDRERSMVLFPSLSKAFEVSYASEGIKDAPEFWAMPSKMIRQENAKGFVQKKKPAFMCVSA